MFYQWNLIADSCYRHAIAQHWIRIFISSFYFFARGLIISYSPIYSPFDVISFLFCFIFSACKMNDEGWTVLSDLSSVASLFSGLLPLFLRWVCYGFLSSIETHIQSITLLTFIFLWKVNLYCSRYHVFIFPFFIFFVRSVYFLSIIFFPFLISSVHRVK